MRILLGMDESPHSRAALEWVKRGPWPPETSVRVIAAARPVVGTYAEAYAPAAPYMEELWEEQVRFHREVASGAERELREAGLAVESRVAQAEPRQALVEAAREFRADLLVVGSHGRTGVSKLLLGSVAAHVVTYAPCSVLVVKLPHGSS